MVRPHISSYNIPEYDMGAVAMRLLTKMLVEENNSKLDKNIEMSYSFLARSTTK